jgi:hypothetical protein
MSSLPTTRRTNLAWRTYRATYRSPIPRSTCYALFAVVARIVPFDLAKRLLHTAIPESRGVVEFDVFYDHGHPQDLKRVFSSAGFREVEVECTWDQTAYFHAFFPAFLLVLLYQRLAELCRIRILASYAIVRATR